MESILKKMGPAAALSLVAFTGVLNAADDAQMRNMENRISALEQKKGANGMINPPARPVVKDGVDLFITGEVLVWKAHQDDMAYAVELDATPANNGFNEGRAKHWSGKWAAGFRLGLGYNMPHDGWDLNLMWTRFNTSHKASNDCGDCGCSDTGFFQPIFLPKDYSHTVGTPTFATEAESKKWKLNLNMVDLEMGREFFVSKWLTLRPHVGLRGAWIHQKFGVNYIGGNFGTNFTGLLAGANAVDFESMKNNFWGVGLRGGLDTQWGLGKGFSIYGKLALSVLWGKFSVSEHAEVENQTVGTRTDVMNISNKFHVCRPIADMALGLRYDTTFADDTWGWGIWAGWEHHYFWGQNKLFKFVGNNAEVFDENDGDLSTSGVNIGMSFDF